MKKVTIQASPDIALIKYWGKKNEKLRLPENGSISLILDGLRTTTTVQFDPEFREDNISLPGKFDQQEIDRVIKHLDRIRKIANIQTKAKVVSQNSFPKSTGLSSSSSGFAALTIAATKAAGLNLSEKQLSILARQGSGSACRCVCSGIVEWQDGNSSATSFSTSLYSPDYWDIRDVIAIVDEGRKKTSSSEGHKTAKSSPFFDTRKAGIQAKIDSLKKSLQEKDFKKLGMITEQETLEFHSILLTSQPSIIAWQPGTVEVMQEVQRLREEENIPVFFSISTGFNVHVLTIPEFEKTVSQQILALKSVKKIINSKIGSGPQEIDQHLF